MMSYMLRKGAQPLSLILLMLVAMICARAAPMEEKQEMPAQVQVQMQAEEQEQEQDMTTTEMVLVEKREEQHRIDCKLSFDATMDSLEQQKLMMLQLQDNGCNVSQTTSSSSSTNKLADAHRDIPTPESVLRHSMSALSKSRTSSSQPLYELQLVVWPSDIEQGGNDLLSAPAPAPAPSTTTTTTTTTISPSLLPLYEDQLVVFPQMDFEEENFDYFLDELQPAANASSTQRPPLSSSTTTLRPTSTRRPTTIEPPPTDPVYVVENYRLKHANGTEEHKLVLSNGLVNYIKLYLKRVGDRVINVQEGYNSVPMAGNNSQIQTLHYIADERGYNVYKIEYSPWPRVLPTRELFNATKSPKSMPDI